MNRAARVIALAPVAPPCFESRSQWLAYLDAAATHQRLDHAPGPLLIEPGRPARFNPRFSYCEDCDMAYRSRMLKQDRCDREFVLRQLEQPEQQEAA